MIARPLTREIDGYLHTLEFVPIKEGKLWVVEVVQTCLELSTWPIACERRRGGKSKSDTKAPIEAARAKAMREGWSDDPASKERVLARKAEDARDLAARLAKFPSTALDRKLAEAIAKPKGVTTLDLRGGKDRLTVIPPTIRALRELEVLHLENNALTSIPEEIGELASLRALHLAHNALRTLPRIVWFLVRLVVLDLHGNPIIPSQNFGSYQQPGIELQIAGTARALRWLPYGKLRVLGTDTDALFPLEIEGEFPLEVLHLYGRAPTKKELATLKRTFPSAAIEQIASIEEGPHIVTALTVSAPPPEAKRKPMHPDHVDALDDLVALAKKHRIAERDVRDHAIPYVRFTTREAKKADLAPGATRIGGLPDLPPRTPWPKGGEGSMLFVAQLDLAQLAPFDASNRLPASGLLSFFVEGFDSGKVIFSEGDVAPRELPDDVMFVVEMPEPLPVCGVDIEAAIAVDFSPSDPKEGAKWQALGKARRKKKGGVHSAWIGDLSGETYGMIAEDDIVLLQVGSDPRADMMWGDCGNLFFVIDPKSLARRAWDRVRVATTA